MKPIFSLLKEITISDSISKEQKTKIIELLLKYEPKGNS